jgi:ribulose-phosphate 3-epimerase
MTDSHQTPVNISEWKRSSPRLNPSVLAADFGHLADDLAKAKDAGATVLHLDIMDGHFVPNLSYGIPVVEAIRRASDLPLDVHLMISEPEKYIGPFRDAGADWLTIHIEVATDPTELLGKIHDLGAAAGLSLNPPTPIEKLEPFVSLCDLVLVMSVMPGFGGQSFDPVALDKLRRLRQVGGDELVLSIDGGVNEKTIADCTSAGADLLVAGTAFFGHPDYKTRHAELLELAKVGKANLS